MPHIHTNPGEHDPTASAFIIRFDTTEPQVLLHRHKKLNTLMQPGGHVELTETPWQAVLHEITEETGYELDQLDVLQPYQRFKSLPDGVIHPVPMCENTHAFPAFDHYHTDRVYVFATHTVPANAPAEGESTALVWASADDLTSMPPEEILDDIRKIGLYALSVCAPDWERVPISNFGS